MKLNESSQKPLYVQLKQIIKEEIERGKYLPGEQLPPESSLCDIYKVSRITARRAISDLVEEGVLHRQQGKGTFVKDFKVKRQLVSVGSFSEITSASGKTPRTQILSSTVVLPDEKLETIFNIDSNTKLFKLHRLLFIEDEPSVDGDPFIIETSYYPLDRLPNLEKYVGTSGSTYRILKEKYGIKIMSSEKTLDLVYATEYEANLFHCDLGTPLYLIEKTAFDQDQRPVHMSHSLFLSNKVTFTLSIDRPNPSE